MAKSSSRDRGFLLGGREHFNGEEVVIRSPWDQTVVGTVRQALRKDAIEAVRLLDQSFAITRRIPGYERKRILLDVAGKISEQKNQLARLIVAEAGKPLKAAQVEVERAVLTFTTAAEEAVRLGGEVLPLDLLQGNEGRWGMVRRFAVGPVFGITPFNFPLNLVAHKLAPAVAAGCPVLLKPAPQTPFCSLKLGDFLLEAGWPAEALAVMPLANEDAEFLLEHEDRLKLLSFTGSAKVGWSLKQKAAKKRVVLELGGNAAMIVHSDWPDIGAVAMKAVIAGTSYAGQSCISVQRVYVERTVFDLFINHAMKHAGTLIMGDPAHETTDVGPMIRSSDADRVESWIDEARAAGATVLTGGSCEGSLVEPTLLTGTRSPMKVLDEEVFAPVQAIEPYDDFDAVLAEVDRSRYGLQAGLFTRDAGRIFRAYETLDVGALIVGDTPTWRLDPMPYGGVKDSGMGREGLRYAIEEMTESKLLVMAL
ncbi:MAG TPA: aldehyde dehydrogenase family protein [Pseudacidobacterium sp.]|jgi:acyl-CoA reductase-like NAD-dependent aldehyde dehydrogenase|nr:aldehyde dehydrogenase family protein [Pseudacidobacterium sp.]